MTKEPSSNDIGEQVLALRQRAETAKVDVTRQETLFEQSEAELKTAEDALRAEGLDPDGDLEAQSVAAKVAVENDLTVIAEGLAKLKADKEAPRVD